MRLCKNISRGLRRESWISNRSHLPHLQSGNPSKKLLGSNPSSSDLWFHLDEATRSASVGCRVPQLVNWVTCLFASEHHFGMGTRPTLLGKGAKDEEFHTGQTMDQFKVVNIDLCVSDLKEMVFFLQKCEGNLRQLKQCWSNYGANSISIPTFAFAHLCDIKNLTIQHL